jgi:hypothetical protein
MADIEIVGEPTEHDSPIPGSVVLTWTLVGAPDAEQVQLFNDTNVAYAGPGALDFQNIDHPTIAWTSVRWTVPAHLKQHAPQYIDQRITRANGPAD